MVRIEIALRCGYHSFVDTNVLNTGSVALSVLDVVKDLGVFIDNHLTFTKQLDSVIGKAKQRIYLILKSFQSRDIRLLVSAYKTYILPILDYCSSIWSPHKVTDIDRLENVQRYFTKRLKGLWDVNYVDRLLICSLKSLELRRLLADIVLVFKIVHKLIALKFDDFFELDTNNVTRGHNFKLRVPLCRINCRFNFFSVRVVQPWNSLPAPLVNAASVNIFKSGLDKINLSKHLKRQFY